MSRNYWRNTFLRQTPNRILKEYVTHLRQMKEDGIVEFVSGKSKVNVRLLRPSKHGAYSMTTAHGGWPIE